MFTCFSLWLRLSLLTSLLQLGSCIHADQPRNIRHCCRHFGHCGGLRSHHGHRPALHQPAAGRAQSCFKFCKQCYGRADVLNRLSAGAAAVPRSCLVWFITTLYGCCAASAIGTPPQILPWKALVRALVATTIDFRVAVIALLTACFCLIHRRCRTSWRASAWMSSSSLSRCDLPCCMTSECRRCFRRLR